MEEISASIWALEWAAVVVIAACPDEIIKLTVPSLASYSTEVLVFIQEY